MVEQDIIAIVLAAGKSSRMQESKILLDLDGRPLISHALASIKEAGIQKIFVVVGHEYPDAIAFLTMIPEGDGIDILINHRYKAGMASSIVTAMEMVSLETPAVLLFLADMPFISSKIIMQIVGAFQSSENKDKFFVPCYQGIYGHPVLVPRKYFSNLKKLRGDIGARKLLHENSENVMLMPVDSNSILMDMDTKEDWQKCKIYVY